MLDEKKCLRRDFRLWRNSCQKDYIAKLSRRVSSFLINWPLFSEADSIMGYLAFGNEAVIDDALKAALKDGKKVFVPYIPPQEQKIMKAARLKDFSQLTPGCMGIRTIDECDEFAGRLDLILVPGLAFTKTGIRLGMGGGFYDRFLAASDGTVKAGIAFTPQIAEDLPSEAHDIKMDFIITETGII